MMKLPELLPGHKIRRMLAALLEMQQDILRDVENIDSAIKKFSPSAERRALRIAQNDLKEQLGLLPANGASRPAREEWSPEKLLTKAVEMKEAARKWSAAGHVKKAEHCLKEARGLERSADAKRSRVRRPNNPAIRNVRFPDVVLYRLATFIVSPAK